MTLYGITFQFNFPINATEICSECYVIDVESYFCDGEICPYLKYCNVCSVIHVIDHITQ